MLCLSYHSTGIVCGPITVKWTHWSPCIWYLSLRLHEYRVRLTQLLNRLRATRRILRTRTTTWPPTTTRRLRASWPRETRTGTHPREAPPEGRRPRGRRQPLPQRPPQLRPPSSGMDLIPTEFDTFPKWSDYIHFINFTITLQGDLSTWDLFYLENKTKALF